MSEATPEPTPEHPIYEKVPQPGGATRLFMITCHEGWRSSIVCTDMYEWAADWLLGILGRQPYAPGHEGFRSTLPPETVRKHRRRTAWT